MSCLVVDVLHDDIEHERTQNEWVELRWSRPIKVNSSTDEQLAGMRAPRGMRDAGCGLSGWKTLKNLEDEDNCGD